MSAQVDELDLFVAVELLRFVPELCAGRPEEMNVALCRFTHIYFPAHYFRDEVTEAGDRLAQALGFADLSMEPAP